MARRDKRHKELFDTDRDKIVAEATRLHETLMQGAARITPGCDDYRAIMALNVAIIEAIRALTGEEPKWMQLRVGGPDCGRQR